MNTRTTPYRRSRSRLRRFGIFRETGRVSAPAARAMRQLLSPTTSWYSPAQLELLVDLRRHALQPALQVRHLARNVLVGEVVEERDVGEPERRDLLVARVRVGEDLQERGEVRVAGQRRVLERAEHGGHVVQLLRELLLGARIQSEVLHQQPCF